MKIKYFTDTDTALVEFTENEIKETIEISENIYFDIDKSGNPVSMTIEHANTNAQLPNLFFTQITNEIQQDNVIPVSQRTGTGITSTKIISDK